MARSRQFGSTNPSVRGSIHNIPSSSFIPKDIYNVAIKVQVDLINGEGTVDLNDYDSEPYVLNINVMRRTLNRGLGTLTVIISNPDGIWNQKITGGEVIRVYADYASATQQSFVGRIDVPNKNLDQQYGYSVRLICREWPQVSDKDVCIKYEGIAGTSAITSLVDDWFSSLLTYVNVGIISTIFNRSYTWKKGVKVFRDILNKSSSLGYIDYDGDINTFTSNSNTDEVINVENNCATVDSYGADLQNRKNSIILTGDRVESSSDLFYSWHKKDESNISSFWQKDLVRNDTTIDSQYSAESDCDLLYDDENQNFFEGSLNAVGGLPTLLPGDSIHCSIPLCQIDGEYVIHQYTHTISPSGWVTRVSYTKKLDVDERLFDTRDDAIDGNRTANKNPYGMSGAFVITFEESESQIATNTNTEELNSALILSTGQSTGNAISITKSFNYDILSTELRVFGEDLGSSYYEVSADNGDTWESTSLNTRHTITSTNNDITNLKMRFYLVVDSDNPVPKIYSAWCGVRFD